MKTRLKLGDWNFICDICGNKRKASTARSVYIAGNFSHKACPECWERDHPGNIPPHAIVGEGGPTPWSRPDTAPNELDAIIVESEGEGIVLLDNNTGAILLE